MDVTEKLPLDQLNFQTEGISSHLQKPLKMLAYEILVESKYNSTDLVFIVLDLMDQFLADDIQYPLTIKKLEQLLKVLQPSKDDKLSAR